MRADQLTRANRINSRLQEIKWQLVECRKLKEVEDWHIMEEIKFKNIRSMTPDLILKNVKVGDNFKKIINSIEADIIKEQNDLINEMSNL